MHIKLTVYPQQHLKMFTLKSKGMAGCIVALFLTTLLFGVVHPKKLPWMWTFSGRFNFCR